MIRCESSRLFILRFHRSNDFIPERRVQFLSRPYTRAMADNFQQLFL